MRIQANRFLSLLLLMTAAHYPAYGQDDSNSGDSGGGTPSAEKIKSMVYGLTGTPTDRVIYSGASLIDGTGSPVREDMAIVVFEDRIEQVLPVSDLEEQQLDNTQVVDMSGRYAVPGLIDSHVHLATLPNRKWAEAILYRQLYAGITTVRDMAGDGRALADLSRSAYVKDLPAPDIYYSAIIAGPSFFDDPRTIMTTLGAESGKVPWAYGVSDDSDLPLTIARAKGTFATGIKIYANLPGRLVRNVIAEAQRQEIPVWTHMQVFPASPYDAVEGGAKTVSHACMMSRFVLDPNKQAYGKTGPLASLEDFSLDDPEFLRLIETMSEYDVILDATINMNSNLEERLEQDAEESQPWDCGLELAGSIVSVAFDAGIRIVSGTDYMASRIDRFPAVYGEFEALAAHTSMRPMDVIIAATLHGAAALGMEDEIGTIETGKFANLVFLKENPLEDIGNLRSIELTVKRGSQYYRSDYIHTDIPQDPGF